MYKRFLALALAIVVLVLLAGCKSKQTTVITETTVLTEEPTVETTEVLGPQALDDSLPTKEETVTTTEPKATEPKATEPKATEPKATEPKVTEPEATEPKATEPNPTEPKPTESAPAVGETEYEKYMSMSGAEQKAYMESFGSIEAFFNWLQDAKAEYEAAHPDIEIGSDGKVEIG